MNLASFRIQQTTLFSDRHPAHPAMVCNECGDIVTSWARVDPSEVVSLLVLCLDAEHHVSDAHPGSSWAP